MYYYKWKCTVLTLFFLCSVGGNGYVYFTFGLPSEFHFHICSGTLLCKCSTVIEMYCLLHVFDAGWDTCLIKSVDILAQLAVSSGIV
jgi:hypothetical protein